MSTNVHIVINPVSGQGYGPEFVKTYIEPILQYHSISYQKHITTAPLDAGRIGRDIRDTFGSSKYIVLIIGGDGTAHEFIEGLTSTAIVGKWELILFPFGTANALYSSLFPPTTPPPNTSHLAFLNPPISEATTRQLSSLLAYLDGKTSPLALPITTTLLTAPDGSNESITSHVVLSTSLHAHILNTSETLRAAHPGPERFALAARSNASRFFEADLCLKTSPSDAAVQQWYPKNSEFITPFTADNIDESGAVHVKGPFAYFLTTSTTDRLEPTFVISPHTSLRPPINLSSGQETISTTPTIFVVVLRPLRDPRVKEMGRHGQGEVWSKRAFEVLMRAYKAGEHVGLTYPSPDESASEDNETSGNAILLGEGEVVVELFKCGSAEWIPSLSASTGEIGEDGGANLVCADGSLHKIPIGGQAKISVAQPTEKDGFYVWA